MQILERWRWNSLIWNWNFTRRMNQSSAYRSAHTRIFSINRPAALQMFHFVHLFSLHSLTMSYWSFRYLLVLFFGATTSTPTTTRNNRCHTNEPVSRYHSAQLYAPRGPRVMNIYTSLSVCKCCELAIKKSCWDGVKLHMKWIHENISFPLLLQIIYNQKRRADDDGFVSFLRDIVGF